MLGAFRTLPTLDLLKEADILPVSLSLQDQIRKNIIRIQTLPTNNPMTLWFERAQQMHIAKIKPFSNLERLMDENMTTTDLTECILPHIRPPWWENPIKIDIPIDKELAIEKHNQTAEANREDPDTICIYTDGSGINNAIAAAAHDPATELTAHQYMGPANLTNVFAAELVGVKTAIEMAKQQNKQRCYIFADSQAAIRAAHNPRKQSGQYILAEIADLADNLVRINPKATITIQWTPGHKGVPGNEKADEEAKRAAIEQLGKQKHPKLKSKLIEQANATTAAASKALWAKGAIHHTHHRRISKPSYVQFGNKLYDGLTRRNTATLVRLRTGHCSLNNYLNRFRITESPECQCGHTTETVRHYVMECPLYNNQRNELQKAVGARNFRLERLLGQKKYLEHTLRYVNTTNRFSNTQE